MRKEVLGRFKQQGPNERPELHPPQEPKLSGAPPVLTTRPLLELTSADLFDSDSVTIELASVSIHDAAINLRRMPRLARTPSEFRRATEMADKLFRYTLFKQTFS
jgi:hypothetical protein